MFEKLKKEYDENGYAIVRSVIDPELVSEVENHVHWLSEKYPDTRPEAFHHNLLVNDPFIHHLLESEKILDVIESIIGPDIALFGAHYIAKNRTMANRSVGTRMVLTGHWSRWRLYRSGSLEQPQMWRMHACE